MKSGSRASERRYSQPTVPLRFGTRRARRTQLSVRAARLAPPPESGHRPFTEWISDIRRAWFSGATNALSLARLVSEAREDLRESRQWNRLWRLGLAQVPFSKRKAEMLATIGAALGTLSAQTFAQMPSGWSTLDHLARLGRRKAEQLIAKGMIHPGLTLQGAKNLLADDQPGLTQAPNRSAAKRQLARFAGFVRRSLASWSAEERRLGCAELLRLAAQLNPDLFRASVAVPPGSTDGPNT